MHIRVPLIRISCQQTSVGSLRRHAAASLMQYHRSVERKGRALHPASPASYASPLEVTPYHRAISLDSSSDYKGRALESGYSLKTSAELLKVLNRVWTLEEQHLSNVSLVRALKLELDHARARIKDLILDQKSNRLEIDGLMKQIAEDKVVKKSKELDRLNSAVQSVREELVGERKLRKRSESLHRKLAREISELNSSLSSALKDLEREKKSKTLLEDLCDEFAGGIRDYEHELHDLKQKYDEGWTSKADRDRSILHISESWLDQRLQMRVEENQHRFVDKDSIVDKLHLEIEAFLQAKRMSTSSNLRRSSMESFPLNEAVSAPHGSLESREDSMDSKGVEGHVDEMVESSRTKMNIISHEKSKGQNHPLFNQNNTSDFDSQLADDGGANPHETCRLNSSPAVKLSSEGGSMHPENEVRRAACGKNSWRNLASPIRPWMLNPTPEDLNIPESLLKPPQIIRGNTLKAKLLEARSEGSRSRLKASKGSS